MCCRVYFKKADLTSGRGGGMPMSDVPVVHASRASAPVFLCTPNDRHIGVPTPGVPVHAPRAHASAPVFHCTPNDRLLGMMRML
jgi:hypothetical protein